MERTTGKQILACVFFVCSLLIFVWIVPAAAASDSGTGKSPETTGTTDCGKGTSLATDPATKTAENPKAPAQAEYTLIIPGDTEKGIQVCVGFYGCKTTDGVTPLSFPVDTRENLYVKITKVGFLPVQKFISFPKEAAEKGIYTYTISPEFFKQEGKKSGWEMSLNFGRDSSSYDSDPSDENNDSDKLFQNHSNFAQFQIRQKRKIGNVHVKFHESFKYGSANFTSSNDAVKDIIESDSLNAHFDVAASWHPECPLYGKGSVDFYLTGDENVDKFIGDYYVKVGTILDDEFSVFRNSYFEVGYGRSERFDDENRWTVEASVDFHIDQYSWVPFAVFRMDKSADSDISDEAMVTFGIRTDLFRMGNLITSFIGFQDGRET